MVVSDLNPEQEMTRLSDRTGAIIHTEEARIGLVGIGSMGRGLLYQSLLTPKTRMLAAAELKLGPAIEFVKSLGVRHRVVDTQGALQDAVRAGELALCEDARLVAEADGLNVFLESSSSVREALAPTRSALETKKHLVLMNAELDLAFGPQLLKLARANGVTYTSCDGDQPGVLARLIRQMEFWGFEIVLAGNIKGFLDIDSNPTKIIPEADKRDLSYHMCAAYTDGTKLCVEMAMMANAMNMRTDVPGMHGPRCADARDALTLFDLEGLRAHGIPTVDYVLGAQPDGGVFVIGYHKHPYQQKMLQYLKMGAGPYYCFTRPYHLCCVESMECILDAVAGKSLLQPDYGYKSNVFACAKKPLRAGETLDGLGGYCHRGLNENCGEGLPDGLPSLLADGVKLTRDIAVGAAIKLSDVEIPEGRADWELYLGYYQGAEVRR